MKRRLSLALLVTLAVSLSFAQIGTPVHDWSKEYARTTPDWARHGVIYEVWERAYAPGGNFASVTARLDRLKADGITILWLMPVNPLGEKDRKGTLGSPYAVRDYRDVNPDYGTPGDLKRLVREAHARQMYVILDVVFNHTAWDNPLLTGHPEYYLHGPDGKPAYPQDWTDVAGLDYRNPQLRAEMVDVLRYWVKEYDVDGFRCDVAGMIPTDFWEQARAELDKVKPGLFLLAEADKPELVVRAFDAGYSWGVMHAIRDAFQAKRPASAIRKAWEAERARFPQGALQMRVADDHDELRLIGVVGERAALAAQALVFTMDGLPLVYNGMEVGDTAESAAPALFERVPVVWDMERKRPQFPEFYRQMARLRQSGTMAGGKLLWLHNSQEQSVVSYLRKDEREEAVVVVNTSGEPLTVKVTAVGQGWMDVSPRMQASTLQMPPIAESHARVLVPTLDRVRLEPWGVRVFTRFTK